MLYYEDLSVDRVDRYNTTYLVTEEESRGMGERWDPQPFLTDSQAAASVFGGLVISTVHLFAIPVKIGMEDEPTAAVSNLGMTNLVNHTPARTGDQPRVGVTVTGRRLSKSRPGEGVVSFRRTLVNQREPVVSNENTALIQCRPA